MNNDKIYKGKHLLDYVGYLEKHKQKYVPEYFVYTLFQGNEIVYVGQTTCLDDRIRTHSYTKEFDSYSYLECIDYETMCEMESMLIISLLPKLNKTIPEGWAYTIKQARKEFIKEFPHLTRVPKFYVKVLANTLKEYGCESIVFEGIEYFTKWELMKFFECIRKEEEEL